MRGIRRNKPHRGCGSQTVLSIVGETEDKVGSGGQIQTGSEEASLVGQHLAVGGRYCRAGRVT